VWNIKNLVSKGDYTYAVVPEHPKCTKNGYVLEHRIVMENYLGRILDDDEVVHHLNGNKKENEIENLELALKREHIKHHALKQGQKMVILKCPECNKIFERRLGLTFLQKGGRHKYTCCSRSCSGKFSRYIQLHGKTATVESAISGNIVSLYNTNDDNPEQTV
jgi:hypothetical protein